MNSYILNNKKVVNEMINREDTFKHFYDNYGVDHSTISDVAFLASSISYETEYCIFDLIKEKRLTYKYDVPNILKSSRFLISDVWDIVFKYANLDHDKIITPSNSNITEIAVDTNLIIINPLDDHIWKKIYKSTYRSDLKVAFISSANQIKNIMKNDFKKANKYDAIIVRTDNWLKFRQDSSYKGYSSDIEFRFSRVFFANSNNCSTSPYCPFANFTWVQRSKKVSTDKYLKAWNPYYPSSSKRVLPWTRDFSSILETKLSVFAIVNNTKYIGDIKTEYMGDYFNVSASYIQIANEINNELSINKDLKYLVILDDNSYIGYTTINLKMKNIPHAVIKPNIRFYQDKFLKKGVNVIVTKEKELYRSDMRLDFIDKIFYVKQDEVEPDSTDFALKFCPYRNKERKSKVDVTIVLSSRHSYLLNDQNVDDFSGM